MGLWLIHGRDTNRCEHEGAIAAEKRYGLCVSFHNRNLLEYQVWPGSHVPPSLDTNHGRLMPGGLAQESFWNTGGDQVQCRPEWDHWDHSVCGVWDLYV